MENLIFTFFKNYPRYIKILPLNKNAYKNIKISIHSLSNYNLKMTDEIMEKK
jgi:hypothetical protein